MRKKKVGEKVGGGGGGGGRGGIEVVITVCAQRNNCQVANQKEKSGQVSLGRFVYS